MTGFFQAKVELIPHPHATQRGMARLKAIERNGSRLAVMLHRFPEERGRRDFVASAAQVADRLTLRVYCTIQVHPAAANLDVGLISPP